MQTLVDIMAADGILYKVRTDHAGCVTHRFFAFPEALKMLKLSPSVLQIDATYKTNEHCMPLVHAIGVTSTYKTYSAFYCFSASETLLDYKWVLQTARELVGPDAIKFVLTDCDAALMRAIREEVPNARNLLCTWHIWQNVQTNHQNSFKSKEDFDEWYKAWTDSRYAYIKLLPTRRLKQKLVDFQEEGLMDRSVHIVRNELSFLA